MTASDIITLTLDCHAGPFDGEEYPSLVEVAERYGILIYDRTDGHPWGEWAWWYEVVGPRAHVERFLSEEYCGDDSAMIAESIDCGSKPYVRGAQ